MLIPKKMLCFGIDNGVFINYTLAKRGVKWSEVENND